MRLTLTGALTGCQEEERTLRGAFHVVGFVSWLVGRSLAWLGKVRGRIGKKKH